jgi:predicted secreted Zn-dependent protease
VANSERSRIVWRRSGACANGDCVEVAIVGQSILVRDSKDPAGPILSLTHSQWTAFLVGVRSRTFDRAKPLKGT